MRAYFYRVLVALDMLGNVLFFPRSGLPDETISAHAGRMKQRQGWARVLSWLLNKIQKQHVEGAIEGDKERAERVETIEADAQK